MPCVLATREVRTVETSAGPLMSLAASIRDKHSLRKRFHLL